MTQKRFSVEQIVAILKQGEGGVPLVELIRRLRISEQCSYRWKMQYVGLEVERVPQLKQLQEENTRLKLHRPFEPARLNRQVGLGGKEMQNARQRENLVVVVFRPAIP